MYETLCTPRIPDEAAMARCRARWDGVAKPLNGLGQLEDIICRMAGLTGTDEVCLDPKSVLVLCADNGVVARGVTQSDASVTAAVARSIAMGRGNVCRMAGVAGARVIPGGRGHGGRGWIIPGSWSERSCWAPETFPAACHGESQSLRSSVQGWNWYGNEKNWGID